jgi:regulator of replication initiation timing
VSETKNITDERAARRFHQIAVLERQIEIKSTEIAGCKAHLKELTEETGGLLLRLRAAARNEGELPLFNLDDE